MNRRRILIILGALVILGILGAGTYFAVRTISSLNTDTSGSLPTIGGDFATVTSTSSDIEKSRIPVELVNAYHPFPDGTVVIVHRNGTISRVDENTIASLSSSPIENFASASFSADGKKIMVLTGQQPRSQVNIFDTEIASWRVIPGTFRDAVWAPTGTNLATLTPDPKTGKTTIGIYDTVKGKTTQVLATLNLGDTSIAWPSKDTLIISDKPNHLSTGSAWSLSIPTKRIALVARGKQGFSAIWDRNASNAISFQTNTFGTGGGLRLISGGVEKARLAFITIPDKCAFTTLPGASSSSIPYVICAVPRDQDSLALKQLPDAWYRKEFFTDDVLIGINLETNEVDFTIAPPINGIDATKLQVIGTTVYYVDRATDQLYKSDI